MPYFNYPLGSLLIGAPVGYDECWLSLINQIRFNLSVVKNFFLKVLQEVSISKGQSCSRFHCTVILMF